MCGRVRRFGLNMTSSLGCAPNEEARQWSSEVKSRQVCCHVIEDLPSPCCLIWSTGWGERLRPTFNSSIEYLFISACKHCMNLRELKSYNPIIIGSIEPRGSSMWIKDMCRIEVLTSRCSRTV